MRLKRSLTLTAGLVVAPFLTSPIAAQAATVSNPLCPAETAIYAPGHAQDIVVPPGFRVSVFARGLNAPTGIAFQGNKNNFKVYVLESGHGIPQQMQRAGFVRHGHLRSDKPIHPRRPGV